MSARRTSWWAIARVCVLAAASFALAAPATAQAPITAADIQRLQDDVFAAGGDLSRLRGTADASRLQGELDDLREEVVYLKVKLRKEGTVSRAEYTELRDRIQELRSRARGADYSPGTGGTRAGTAAQEPSRTSRDSTVIPAGQQIDVRLQTSLGSATAQPEQRFEATTVVDLYHGSSVLIPAGSIVRGLVSSVTPATRTARKGSLTVAFDQVMVRGRAYPMRGTVTQALEGEGLKGEAVRIGAGAGVGAIIGGIIGGAKGALLGVLVGGGAMIAATEGTDVSLPAGTILRVSLDSPPDVR